MKNSSNMIEDYEAITGLEVYKVTSEEKEIGFTKLEDGSYISNNSDVPNSTSRAVIPIDLTNKEGDYRLVVDAEIACDKYDMADVVILDELNVPVFYDHQGMYTYCFDNLIEERGPVKETKKVETTLEGGKLYYLEFGFNRATETIEGDDYLKINSISLTNKPIRREMTDENGKISLNLPTGKYTVVEIMQPDGYILPEGNSIAIELDNDGKEITIENEQEKGTVIVHHYLEGTENPILLKDKTLSKDEEKRGFIGAPYATKPREDAMDYYYVVDTDGPTSGEYEDGTIEVTYYYQIDPDKDKELVYTINYYKDDILDEEASGEVTEIVKALEDEASVQLDINELREKYLGYRLDEEKTIIPATVHDGDEINIYYYLKDANLIIKYKEKGIDTEDVLIPDKEIDAKYFEEYSLEDYIETIDGYVLDRDFVNEEFAIDDDNVIKTIYYEPKGKVIIHYMDIDSEEQIDSMTEEGIVGDELETYPITIKGYALEKGPDDRIVVVTKEDQDVYYYYKAYDSGVIERHIDADDGRILYEEYHEGEIGTEYNILPKEFDRYELDEENLPTNSEGTMTDNLIEVEYTYNYLPLIKVRYVNVDTNEDIIDPVIIKGHIGDEYHSEEKPIERYEFERIEGTPEGTITREDVEIIYYYKKVQNRIIENHIDILDDEILYNEEIALSEGESYETSPINLEDYDVVIERLPANGRGEMGDEDIIINYYYIRKAEVNVEYIDFNTGKPITEETTFKGHVGDEYTSKEENIPGYRLVKDQYPENASGTMTKEPTTVTYLYVKEVKVTEKHVFKDTVLYEETHTGIEGDEYDIEPIAFDDYLLDEERRPSNTKGYMHNEDITITYYYVEKAVVIEKHIDEDTKEILAYEKHEGKIGDTYRTKARKFPGYSDEYSCTDNNMGLMTKEPIEVIYWYKQKPKQEVPAQEAPKAQEPAPTPVTVIVQDGNGNTKSTIPAKSGDTVVVKKDTSTKVVPKVDPDYEKVANVPDTDSETNRIFYAIAAGLVCIGVVIIIAVAIINKRKNKEE